MATAGMLCLWATPCRAAALYGLDEQIYSLFANTLAGHLLFGFPHAGVTITDSILVAILAFLLLKLLSLFLGWSSRKEESGKNVPAAANGGAGTRGAAQPREMAFAQDSRKGKDGEEALPSSGIFDKEEFLRSAKKLFTRLQASWDRRDVDDIATFSTPAIIREVRAQAEVDPTPSTTQILLVNASLVSTELDGEEEVASVFFDILLREDPKKTKTTQIKEIWHFTRPANSGASWKLDGIQQVD